MLDAALNPSELLVLDKGESKDFRFGNDKVKPSAGALTYNTLLLGRQVQCKTHLMPGWGTLAREHQFYAGR